MKTLNIISSVMVCAAALTGVSVLTSCDDKYEMDLPLALTQHNLDLNAGGGEMHVLVYCADKWSARLLNEKDALWCSLENTSGEKNSDLFIKYAANNGASRRTFVEIASNEGLVDTLTMTQAGYVGGSDVSLLLMSSFLTVGAQASTESVEMRTNLDLALESLATVVVYEDEYGDKVEATEENPGWITNVRLDREEVTFDIAPNATGSVRKAIVRVYLPNLPTYSPGVVYDQPYRVASEVEVMQSI